MKGEEGAGRLCRGKSVFRYPAGWRQEPRLARVFLAATNGGYSDDVNSDSIDERK